MKRSELIRDIIVFALMFLLGLGLIIFLEATRAHPAEKADIQKLYDYVDTHVNEIHTHYNMMGEPYYTKSIGKKIVTLPPPPRDFDWAWEVHILSIRWAEYDGKKYSMSIGILLKKYQDEAVVACLECGFVNCELIMIDDLGSDGKVDDYRRKFYLQSKDGYEQGFTPPRGFINGNWFRPGKEVIQSIFDKEIQFWLNQTQTAGDKDAKP